MCFLTKLSESLNKKQKRGFFLAFALIAAISVLEVITIVVDGAPPGYRWLNILSNYLGFGLTPAVARCLVYVLDKKTIIRRGFKAAVCCEGGYLLFDEPQRGVTPGQFAVWYDGETLVGSGVIDR